VLREHGIGRIEVLAVNLYPFTTVARDPAASWETLVENIDVGGPTMLRAAAKNHEAVTVLVDPADYGPALEMLRAGGVPAGERRRLAMKVFRHTAAYDAAIANRLAPETLPPLLLLPLARALPLRYGENPHQAGAYYEPVGGAGFDAAALVKRGRELSYNNILDLDAAWAIARELAGTGPAGTVGAVIVKHGNPCGAARGADLEAAYRAARDADAESAFGSVVALTSPLDLPTARAIAETFVEVVAAPRIGEEARGALDGKKGLRLVEMGDAPGVHAVEVRAALTGFLVQEPDAGADPECRVATRRAPTDAEMQDLLFAMSVCRHVKSNAIVLARGGVTTGVGAGQMSRVESVRIATRKAGARAAGSVLASDAFFPFPDGIVAAHESGVTAVIQPGGSVKDAEVVAEADARGMAMVLTGRRHFRH
jgi:phosphoribosylaminoimidazolecarboxamide formyltransferase/IMP cyclohydrolase